MTREPTMSARRRVVAIGPFPPAVTGAAKNTAIICSDLEGRGAVTYRLQTNSARGRDEHVRTVGLYARKTLGFVSNMGGIMSRRLSFPAGGSVYLVPDGGLGVAFSAAYARVASARSLRLIVHHRNYSHIRDQSRMMAQLVRAAPDRTLHVFLDPVMERRFRAVYPAVVKSTYVPNAATCDVEISGDSFELAGSRPISVGFLSNLVEDKGFDVVADALVILARRLGPKARFLLAGRPVGPGNLARLTELRAALGDQLCYQGEVFGDSKVEFFRSCDIFVFPTRYSQEAQPNVLYEAMAGGSLIVSTNWAGVPWMLGGTVSRIVEPGADRADDIVAAVEDLASTHDLPAARARQVKAFHNKKLDADARYERLLDHILGVVNF